MKIRIKLILKIFIMVFIFFAGLEFWNMIDFGTAIKNMIIESKKTRQRNVRLLCKTDHQALLEACREVSKMFARGDLKKSQYWIRKNRGAEISHFPTASSERVRFPQVILDLEPTMIDIGERVMLELGTSFHHFGVYAYPDDEDYKPGDKYGDKELIRGLWYYNDGYHETPDYGRRIDALIEKYKKKQEKSKPLLNDRLD
jgi:hypothetical protein